LSQKRRGKKERIVCIGSFRKIDVMKGVHHLYPLIAPSWQERPRNEKKAKANSLPTENSENVVASVGGRGKRGPSLPIAISRCTPSAGYSEEDKGVRGWQFGFTLDEATHA